MKKKILTTIILIMLCTLASCQCVKAETEIKSTIQIKYGATSWTNISASDAYDKCQELNNENSALGKTGNNVMAHLSTNADWFAVSLLAMSSYGTGKEGTSGNTTNNNSGIFSFGKIRVFTAGIYEGYETTTHINMQSIIDNKNTKFVEKMKRFNYENKPGLGFLASEYGNFGKIYYYSDENYIQREPMTNKMGWFGGYLGTDDACAGKPMGSVTFRPAIWVK